MIAAAPVGAVGGGASQAYGVDETAYTLETANKELLFMLPAGVAIVRFLL